MNRIQQALNRAEREGRPSRTRGFAPLRGEAEAFVCQHAPSQALEERDPPGPGVGMAGDAASPAAPDSPGAVGAPSPGRQLALAPDPLLVAAVAPFSPAAEQYRALRLRLVRAENGETRRVLLVTSPGRGDGKTVTCANLALTMAQEHQRRILLVDADLRNPGLHKLLGLPASPGLAELLLGGATLDEAIVGLPEHHLSVICAGVPPDRPAELLGSPAMKRLLADLRPRFDRVVIDTPPGCPVADAGVLGRLVDGVVVVIRAGRTALPAVERVVSDVDEGKLLGLVLNDARHAMEAYAYASQPPFAGRVSQCMNVSISSANARSH